MLCSYDEHGDDVMVRVLIRDVAELASLAIFCGAVLLWAKVLAF
jgi:hypothetical protein